MSECPSAAWDSFCRSQEPNCHNCRKIHKDGSKAQAKCEREMKAADDAAYRDWLEEKKMAKQVKG